MKMSSEKDHRQLRGFVVMTENTNIRAFEPWPGYFELRSKEMEVLLKFWKPQNIENLLEIGCGPGFVSTILSGFSNKVFTTDLISFSERTNTRGMEATLGLLRARNKRNISFFGSNALSLPLRSKCMDVVFSMSLLEHIALDKRDRAIQEMKRVLKDGGVIVAIIPNITERIGAFLHYYADLAIRVVKKAARIGARNDKNTRGKEGPASRRQSVIGRFLPPIHGYYKNHLEELSSQLPFKWESLFRRNGLEIIKTFTIRFSPFSTKAFISLYNRTSFVDSFFGDKIPFKYFGKNYCVMCRKVN